jgi:hypothetical protein
MYNSMRGDLVRVSLLEYRITADPHAKERDPSNE